MRNKNSKVHFGSKKGKGGTPLPNANSKTPSGNEKLEKGSKGPVVKGVKEPVKKESLETSKKNLIGNINTFNMSKSLFDKLFEDVMSGGMDEAGTDLPTGGDDFSDEQALGIDAGGEDDMGGDEVTITLDRAMAQQFCDALQAALGGGMGEEEGDEEFSMDDEDFGDDEMDEDEEEGGNPFGEATDIEELGAEAKAEHLKKKGNDKVKVSSQYSVKGGGKANIGNIPAQDTGSAFTKKSNLHDKGQHKVSSFNYSDSAFNGGSR